MLQGARETIHASNNDVIVVACEVFANRVKASACVGHRSPVQNSVAEHIAVFGKLLFRCGAQSLRKQLLC